jgi:FkbM family methyltransferase
MKKKLYLFISSNRRKLIFKTLAKLARFYVNAFENLNNDHNTNGEFWLMNIIKSFHIKVVFDVGANVGKWTTEARNLFHEARIYSFEPIPDVFEQLHSNTKNLPLVSINNIALSNVTGELSFNYYPKANLFSSIYDHPGGKDGISLQVISKCGEKFCNENEIDCIDFLKIDTEGSEPLVLEGFKEMLKNKKIRLVQFEYGITNIDAKFILKDFFKLFKDNGYNVGKIFPNYIDFSSYNKENENFKHQNYIAVIDSETELIKVLKG